MTKNDTAWEMLFQEHGILNKIAKSGICEISALSINKHREARLMTKFDHAVNLPKIFADNGLAILPNSRNSYVIGRFDCYAPVVVNLSDTPLEGSFPNSITSLAPDNLYSESSALLCAYHAGLIADVLEIEGDLNFTVFGRMSTGIFDFSIQAASDSGTVQHKLQVDRAQCEIDGGFESAESFAILEVKNEEVTDFHIRQLYFPYRLWKSKIEKPVIPMFMTYSNEIFTISSYNFTDLDDYNSLQLIKRKRYQIVPTTIEVKDIRQALAKPLLRSEPSNIPFPQADTIERVIDLLVQLQVAGGSLTQEDITTNYAFDIRQTQYYSNAARYLGLLERNQDKRGVFYTLTELGTDVMKNAPKMRNLALVELILRHRVFRDAMKYYLSESESPPPAKIVEMMMRANIKLDGTTPLRRAQTVLGWIKWIIQLTTDS